MALPPGDPNIPSSDEIVALCRWLPNGGNAGNIPTDPTQPMPASPDTNTDWVFLSIDDCWVEIEHDAGRTRFIVHAQYVGREGERFYITGEERAIAEDYANQMAKDLAVNDLLEVGEYEGTPLFANKDGHFYGRLINPFTEQAWDDVYPISVEHQDEGGRYYGLDITFERIDEPSGAPSAGTPDFTWGAVDIGDMPGKWELQVENNFIRYTVTTSYRGDVRASITDPVPTVDHEYLQTLSNALGLYPLNLVEFPRGTLTNLGVVKSYQQTADTLTWVSKSASEGGLYPEAVSGSLNEDDILELTVTFVKAR